MLEAPNYRCRVRRQMHGMNVSLSWKKRPTCGNGGGHAPEGPGTQFAEGLVLRGKGICIRKGQVDLQETQLEHGSSAGKQPRRACLASPRVLQSKIFQSSLQMTDTS